MTHNYFLYVVSSHLFEVCRSSAMLKMPSSGGAAFLNGRNEVVKANFCSNQSFGAWGKLMKTMTVGFRASACCIQAYSFLLWSCSLQIGLGLFVKTAGLFLLRHICSVLPVETLECIKLFGSWHGLTQSVEVDLSSVNPSTRLTCVCRSWKESFSNHHFACMPTNFEVSDIGCKMFHWTGRLLELYLWV